MGTPRLPGDTRWFSSALQEAVWNPQLPSWPFCRLPPPPPHGRRASTQPLQGRWCPQPVCLGGVCRRGLKHPPLKPENQQRKAGSGPLWSDPSPRKSENSRPPCSQPLSRRISSIKILRRSRKRLEIISQNLKSHSTHTSGLSQLCSELRLRNMTSQPNRHFRR